MPSMAFLFPPGALSKEFSLELSKAVKIKKNWKNVEY